MKLSHRQVDRKRHTQSQTNGQSIHIAQRTNTCYVHDFIVTIGTKIYSPVDLTMRITHELLNNIINYQQTKLFTNLCTITKQSFPFTPANAAYKIIQISLLPSVLASAKRGENDAITEVAVVLPSRSLFLFPLPFPSTATNTGGESLLATTEISPSLFVPWVLLFGDIPTLEDGETATGDGMMGLGVRCLGATNEADDADVPCAAPTPAGDVAGAITC